MTKSHFYKAGWIAALAAMLLISACGDRKGATDQPSATETAAPSSSAVDQSETPAPTPTPSASANDKIADEFVQKASSDVSADQLMSELGRSVAGASPSEADEMFRAMDGYYTRNLPELEKKFQSEDAQKELSKLQFPVTKDQIDGLKNEEIRKMIQQAVDGGYKLETSEGYVFPVVDYAALLKLADKASPAMKDYLSIVAAESENKSLTDAALIISREELVQRTLAAESYLKQYPNEPEHDIVETRFLNYLFIYLVGVDNTPIFDDKFQVLPEMKKDFEKTAADHPDTVTAKLTAEFLDILTKTKGAVFKKGSDGMQVDIPEVKAFRDNIEKKAKESLKS